MTDETTSVAQLKEKILQFSKDRDWSTTDPNDAKNFTMALAVEAAELMEIFMWTHSNDVGEIRNNPEEFIHLQEEIADVFWYLIRLCQCMDIDLTKAVCDKEVKNAKKYPPLF